MKKTGLLLIVIVLLFSGCAFHKGLTSNQNSHVTEVVLSQNNFKVIDIVQGDAEATYILGFGGIAKQAMIAEAKTEMLTKSNIIGGAKAIINETLEIKKTNYLFVKKIKVVVSAHIVEFTQ
ncbi:MAG: DUF6567 family protein [Bacteroidota bacterium]